jgi:hypothetical protein
MLGLLKWLYTLEERPMALAMDETKKKLVKTPLLMLSKD